MQRYYLPVVQFQWALGEPNNSCDEAHPITTGVAYHFLPDDLHDWYEFTLTGSGNLRVELFNFVPAAGQLAVYKGDSCSSRILLGSNGDFVTSKVVSVGQQTAGRYYIYVSNDGSYNSEEPYILQVVFP